MKSDFSPPDYRWGDVPALMPIISKLAKVPGFRFDGSGKSFQSASVETTGYKSHGLNWSDRSRKGQDFTRRAGEQHQGSSKSPARKAASAMIAKIPLTLARHVAAVWRPRESDEN